MALQVTISGTTQIYFGGQTALMASVIDTETGQAPAGLQYAWTASDGSFVGATNGASTTYHADFTSSTDQTVTITCEVTLPGNTNPTVSAPSLTAMDELGITGQLVNMLVTAEPSGSDLFDRTDDTAIASAPIRTSPTTLVSLGYGGVLPAGSPSSDLERARSVIFGMPPHGARILHTSSSAMAPLSIFPERGYPAVSAEGTCYGKSHLQKQLSSTQLILSRLGRCFYSASQTPT